MFSPNAVYYEEAALSYPLGRELFDRYGKAGVPCIPIENHNNIPEMRRQPNAAFPKMKRALILGIRKTHRYVENHKTSDYLVPYTSSGCTAMCLYCYLVCHYNKCAYLRVFVNREQMLDRLIKTADRADRPLTFEIGSNSDLILENTITGNLPFTIEGFQKARQGFLTFPTKFDMVDGILGLNHGGRVTVRMSVNPSALIRRVELGTSPLLGRAAALNKLKAAGYPVGILVAPVMLVEGWEALYQEMFKQLADTLSDEVKKNAFFEVIFMTYSYVHRAINQEAFPNAPDLFDPALMTGRGKGKYAYQTTVREEAGKTILSLLRRYFPGNRVWYVV